MTPSSPPTLLFAGPAFQASTLPPAPLDVPDVSFCLGSGVSLLSPCIQMLPFGQDPLYMLLQLWRRLLIPPAG